MRRAHIRTNEGKEFSSQNNAQNRGRDGEGVNVWGGGEIIFINYRDAHDVRRPPRWKWKENEEKMLKKLNLLIRNFQIWLCERIKDDDDWTVELEQSKSANFSLILYLNSILFALLKEKNYNSAGSGVELTTARSGSIPLRLRWHCGSVSQMRSNFDA